MAFYEMGVVVDSLQPGTDSLIRARREDACVPVDVGQLVSVDCDDLGIFARVVKFEGDPETGCVCLEELKGEAWEVASEDLALSYEDWCDPLDE